ncbi:methyltransferase family protein [Flavimobilis soli]|uniref:Methyltransferase family protein n=1 Tax=Flavimobilis soli TaxID=442709 RepID=A0A2A9EB63_9MICO|nr:fused MFS/spermidine synthase [Flavimobilis soli]PFG35896.1 methyltransferase family protein [Flavimobilis soli]
MARSSRRHNHVPLTPQGADLPVGPVDIASGTVELEVDRDDPRAVTVHVNGVPSSYVHLDDPTVLAFEYMQQMACLIDALPAGPLSVVHVGAAGCSLARYVASARPGSRQLALDPDPTLLELVRGWFGLPRAPELRLRAQDGREGLAGLRDSSVDVVIRDAFAPDTTPTHLTTQQFLAEVARVVRPGGIYLANIADRAPLALTRAEVATALAAREVSPESDGVRSPWRDVALVAEPAVLKGRRYGNLVLVAARAGADGAQRRSWLSDVDRPLRVLPVPATRLGRDELATMSAGAAPLVDPPDPAAA